MDEKLERSETERCELLEVLLRTTGGPTISSLLSNPGPSNTGDEKEGTQDIPDHQDTSTSLHGPDEGLLHQGTRQNAGRVVETTVTAVKGGQSFLEEKIAIATRSKERGRFKSRAIGDSSGRGSFMNLKLAITNRRKGKKDSRIPSNDGKIARQPQRTTGTSTYPNADVDTTLRVSIDTINKEEDHYTTRLIEDTTVEENEEDTLPSAMTCVLERTTLQRDQRLLPHPGAVAVFPTHAFPHGTLYFQPMPSPMEHQWMMQSPHRFGQSALPP